MIERKKVWRYYGGGKSFGTLRSCAIHVAKMQMRDMVSPIKTHLLAGYARDRGLDARDCDAGFNIDPDDRRAIWRRAYAVLWPTKKEYRAFRRGLEDAAIEEWECHKKNSKPT